MFITLSEKFFHPVFSRLCGVRQKIFLLQMFYNLSRIDRLAFERRTTVLNVLTAFGNQQIQNSLKAEVMNKEIAFPEQDYGWQGEVITAAYTVPDVDVVMAYSGINGNMETEAFVRSLVSNTTGQIILIDDEASPGFVEYCKQFGIERVFENGKVTISALASELSKMCKNVKYPTTNSAKSVLRVAESDRFTKLTKTVGVMGVRTGSGATAAVRDMVVVIKEMGFESIAVVSMDKTGDLQNADLPEDVAVFSAGDMTTVIASRDYEFVIVDFGGYAEFLKGVPKRDAGAEAREILGEYLRSDLCLLVSGGEPWEIENLRTLLRMDTVADTFRNVKVLVKQVDGKARSLRGLGTKTAAEVYSMDSLGRVIKESFGG